MSKKGSVLMISLWILAILVLFALGLGWRASINLRLARYQRDRLKALYLAKAGINRGIVELEKDSKDYDSLNDTWSTGKDINNHNIFEDIEIVEKSGEKFTVNMTDEESKINMNGIDTSEEEQILVELFVTAGEIEKEESKNLKDLVVKWTKNSIKDPEDTKQIFKNELLKIPEELLLILEYFYENKPDSKFKETACQVYDKIKDLITVYDNDNKINVNTSSLEILNILTKAIATADQATYVDCVVNEIIRKRDDPINGPFKVISDISIDATLCSPTDDDDNLFKNLLDNYLKLTSNFFKIESTGTVDNITKKISAVYDRSKDEILYWHEN